MKSVCVYCGSSPGEKPAYREAAASLAKALVDQGLELVYGGGNVGLMGEIADRVMERGGRVVGVIPEALMEKEVGHSDISELLVVKDMHDRKARMAELGDGFIALPGGFGTMEELFEMLTWLQLGFHEKPCAVLNIDGYYDHLLAFLNKATTDGFVKPLHREMLLDSVDATELLQTMADFKPPVTSKWIGWGQPD